jgi:hypothetical protein
MICKICHKNETDSTSGICWECCSTKWEGFSVGEDINCGNMICRKGNLFFKCRADGKYPKFKNKNKR